MKKIYLSVFVLLMGVIQLFGQAEFSTGTLDVVVNAYGRIRLYTPGDDIRHLQRASILVGTSSTTVYDYSNDAGTVEASALVNPPAWGDFQIHGVFDNSDSGNPPAVDVALDAYGWTNKSYTILKFNVKNKDAAAMNAYIGLDIIPELDETYGGDEVNYLADSKVLYFHRGSTGKQMGVKLLSANLKSFKGFEWFDGYSADANYWDWMTSGEIMTSYASTTDDGLVAVISQDAQAINVGESVNVFFAFALGDSQADILNSLQEAQSKYDLISGLGFIPESSTALKLGKNVPNPFSNQTSIHYFLPSNGKVSLKVYDQLGNEVAVLVNEIQSKGTKEVIFNPNKLSPGLYYYTLTFDGKQLTNKMVLAE